VPWLLLADYQPASAARLLKTANKPITASSSSQYQVAVKYRSK
jgi:hypothetical protein